MNTIRYRFLEVRDLRPGALVGHRVRDSNGQYGPVGDVGIVVGVDLHDMTYGTTRTEFDLEDANKRKVWDPTATPERYEWLRRFYVCWGVEGKVQNQTIRRSPEKLPDDASPYFYLLQEAPDG